MGEADDGDDDDSEKGATRMYNEDDKWPWITLRKVIERAPS